MSYKYLFGPVPSRRLGISLGVDLVPHKVCSLNCIYCEVGRTTDCTIERKEYVPVDKVMIELREYLSAKPQLDYLTFSGAGEPTLNIGLGKITRSMKQEFPEYKIALLTNGTLFSSRKIREEILAVDLILPSLDAVSEELFQKINRPAEGLTADKLIHGLVALRSEFTGQIWLEVFLIPGLNDTVSELNLLKKAIQRIKPNKVQLNSLDRPGTEEWVEHITQEQLEKAADIFRPLHVEIIAKPVIEKVQRTYDMDIAQQIFETIKRRPCTIGDLQNSLSLSSKEILKYLNRLKKHDKIETIQQERGIFYKARV